MKRALVYAHYNPDSEVEPYVIDSLRRYESRVEPLVFVSASPLSSADRDTVGQIAQIVCTRDNIGYDFGSYRDGLALLDLATYDEVVITNDSVMGPLLDARSLLPDTCRGNDDFWGATISNELRRHVQSYFVAFSGKVITADAFQNFWQSMPLISDKDAVVRAHEVGLSDSLFAAGFTAGAMSEANNGIADRWRASRGMGHYARVIRQGLLTTTFYRRLAADLKNRRGVNPTLDLWKTQLHKGELAFIKTSLVRSLASQPDDLTVLVDLLEAHTDFDVQLVTDYAAKALPR